MEGEEEIFDTYIPTTVSIGQLLPLLVAGTATCLLFIPVLWLSIRPSNRIDGQNEHGHEDGNGKSSSKISINLRDKMEAMEYTPLISSLSADSSEYGNHSHSSRLVPIRSFNSFDSSRIKSLRSVGSSICSFEDDEVGRRNAIRFSDPNTSAMEKLKIITLNNCDAQTKNMLEIGFPYLIQTLVSAASEFIQMGVVGYQLGTDALTAYVVVDLFIHMTTDAVGFVITNGTTLIAQVVEAEDRNRRRKVGNYLLLSILFYITGMIPLIIFWSYGTKDFLLFLNLDAAIAEEGQNYARAYVATVFLGGILSAFQYTLDAVGYQVETTIMTTIGSILTTSAIVVVMCYHTVFPQPTLTLMGCLYVILELCYFVGMLSTIHVNGWLKPYYRGLFTSPLELLRNWKAGNSNCDDERSSASPAAIKLLVSNTFQYALSNFVFEGEWQILLLFASVLGTAELATWGVLGIIWEELELIVDAISEGCEVRVSQILGSGDFKTAKLVAYKAIWISTIWGIFVSIIFVVFEDEIPMLVTQDPLLQKMVSYNLSMIALANLVSGVAIMAEHVLWSQNRAGPATKIAISTSLGVTIPLTALSSCYFHFNLIGQTTGVVIGAAAFAALSLHAVVRSDWEQIAQDIASVHANDGEAEENDSWID